MASTTPNADFINPILESDEISSEALAPVLEALQKWESEDDVESLRSASNKFWIATRDERWRVPIGDAGILNFFQTLLPKATDPTLALNSLKIVGNACADKDVNRKRVIEHPDSLSHVVEAITKPESCQIASVVLLNICTEYEPSQLSCITHKGVESIFSNISDPEFNSDLDYYLRILELLLAHKEGKAVAPENALETLLRHLETGEEGFDNTLSLVSILSSLLTTSRFQKLTLKESGLFSRVLDMIERTFELTYDAERKDKDKSLIAYARSQLVEAVGEIATDDEFLTVHDLDGEVMKRVAKWLNLQVSKEELAISACLVYGNIGRSDKVCLELVEKGVHVALFEVIEDTAGKFEESVRRVREKKTPEQEAKEKENPPEKLPKGVMAVGIIHAAIGVLKNFAIPQGNKLKLVEAGVFTIIRRLLGLEGIGIAQVWYSAVSLGRLVTINTVESADFILSAPSPGQETLLSIFLRRKDEVDELPVKVEISRTIAAILRLIYSDTEPNQGLLTKLYSHPPTLEAALWEMVIQKQYPVVASEGWFALALLSREKRGAEKVVEQLDVELVKKVLEEETSKDRDNAGVLVLELRKNLEVRREEMGELMDLFLKGPGVVVVEEIE